MAWVSATSPGFISANILAIPPVRVRLEGINQSVVNVRLVAVTLSFLPRQIEHFSKADEKRRIACFGGALIQISCASVSCFAISTTSEVGSFLARSNSRRVLRSIPNVVAVRVYALRVRFRFRQQIGGLRAYEHSWINCSTPPLFGPRFRRPRRAYRSADPSRAVRRPVQVGLSDSAGFSAG